MKSFNLINIYLSTSSNFSYGNESLGLKSLTFVNKNFNVYAEDVYLVEQIFTSDIIQLLNEYYEKFDIKYEFF